MLSGAMSKARSAQHYGHERFFRARVHAFDNHIGESMRDLTRP
jgi:hypothetical protein